MIEEYGYSITVPLRQLLYPGLCYVVIEDDDITADNRPLNMVLTFGPARCTRKWRGKKFNLKTSRVIGIEAI